MQLSAAKRRGVTLDRVRQALAKSGPSQPWPTPDVQSRAAVLAPVFEEGDEARLVLTRRAWHLRSHTGEVSFPGGRLDEGEAPLAAALREASEEVGIDPATVEIIGELSPLTTFSASSGITPFVGALPERPRLQPNPDEVELAFDVAIADLLADGVFREERWRFPGVEEPRPVYFFDLPEDIVWGATARMLYELLELVAFS